MKKITFLLIVLMMSFGYSQVTLPIDFEATPVTADFTSFDGGAATVISNPQSNGINTSATVAQLVRDGGQVWAGAKLTLSGTLDFSTNSSIRMKVYTSAPIGTTMAFKIENGDGSVNIENASVATTVQNAWETLEWSFPSAAPDTYNNIVFLFDLGNLGDGSATSTFLFDDIEQFDSSGGLSQIDLPVNFESSTTDYTVSDFGGNASTLVVDPTDAGNMVMQTIKTSAAETWAGTTIGTAAGFATDIPITASETKMNVRVWSPDAGIPIMLKIETAGTPTQSCETLTNTPVVMGWNTLEFDFANERPGTAALNLGYTFDLASIFFNFDVSGATVGTDKTYYFDDVMFGTTLGVNAFNKVTFKTYPNPTQGSWTIKSHNTQIESITLFNVIGKQVLQISPNTTETIVNGSNLKTGLYFAQIKTELGINSIKLIKN